ncbi:ABC transporter substrate-binding protein [Nocardiopsis ansamitocini]|uniref:Polyamine-binding lipoprotein n=1 Tax=Nocardiopsis ansamitocini TaxID=1670832 RepID=A0A9W6P5M4_9ACTN|nr:spermidine/putrescine ABC transporter substrate-binding protein [Nocardiopsis ansamitocini]GLU47503.1 polyamine-binding lipoprotein [Nocardiopsis ansamitocini]
MRNTPRPSPALLRGLTQARYSRRATLKLTGLSAAALALAGCGVQGQQQQPQDSTDFWADKQSNGKLRFANWPLYMDSDRTQLTRFTEATGVTVDYEESVQDNPSWFGQIQPILANGGDIGADLMVMTNGLELAKLIALGYLAPLDPAQLPNFAEYAGEIYKKTAYDPGNTFTVPYASGMTGIAYDPERTGRTLTSIADLWDPAFEGRVGMMADPQEIANFGLLYNGIDPADSTPDDWRTAAESLKQQRDDKIVRAYYSQDYIQPLTNGDVWATMAWSGDIYQQNAAEGTNLEFFIPEEGATLWTDNMMIPSTAKNPVDALMMMDFLYDPEVAASLAEYITFVPPVPDAQNVLRDKAGTLDGDEQAALEELAASPLVFPTDADYAKLHNYVSLPAGEEEEFTSIFLAITQA